MKLKVVQAFIDKEDHSTIHKVGDTLCISDLSRINFMVRKGICEIVSIDDDPLEDSTEKVSFNDNDYDLEVIKNALGEIGSPVAPNAKVKGVTNAVAKLTEEQTNALLEVLKPKEE